jgi:hypothetical protein
MHRDRPVGTCKDQLTSDKLRCSEDGRDRLGTERFAEKFYVLQPLDLMLDHRTSLTCNGNDPGRLPQDLQPADHLCASNPGQEQVHEDGVCRFWWLCLEEALRIGIGDHVETLAGEERQQAVADSKIVLKDMNGQTSPDY